MPGHLQRGREKVFNDMLCAEQNKARAAGLNAYLNPPSRGQQGDKRRAPHTHGYLKRCVSGRSQGFLACLCAFCVASASVTYLRFPSDSGHIRRASRLRPPVPPPAALRAEVGSAGTTPSLAGGVLAPAFQQGIPAPTPGRVLAPNRTHSAAFQKAPPARPNAPRRAGFARCKPV